MIAPANHLPDSQPGPGHNYYHASAGVAPACSPLTSDLTTEVVIVGAGFAGLHTAWQLHLRGIQCTVLEGQSIGAGASAQNGGHAIPEFACGMDLLAQQLGSEAAHSLWQLLQEAHADLADLSSPLGLTTQIDYVAGHIEAALTPRHAVSLSARAQATMARYGAQLQRLAGVELQTLLGTDRYQLAYLDRNAGHLHPLKLIYALVRALQNYGHDIYCNSRVNACQTLADGRFELIANGQRVVAKTVIWACNAGIQTIDTPLLAPIRQQILPVGTWVIATAPLPPALQEKIIPCRAAVVDTRAVLDYYRISADQRIIFGGGCSYWGSATPKGFAQSLQQRLVHYFPVLRDLPVEYAWGGLIDISLQRAPCVGRLKIGNKHQVPALNVTTPSRAASSGMYYSFGFSGSGVVATAAVARTIAAHIAGIDSPSEKKLRTDFDALSQLRQGKFPLFAAHALTAMGMLYYRLRDQF